MDYTTLALSTAVISKEAKEDFTPACSLYQALQDLPDPRRGQGKRYELALLLCLLILAKLAGQQSAPWSHGVDSSSEHHYSCPLWAAPNDHALSDDLLQSLSET